MPNPQIENVRPQAALPGGEVTIAGNGFSSRNHVRAGVRFGASEGSVVMAADNRLVARLPEDASGNSVQITLGAAESQPFPMAIANRIADNLHAVANPAVDSAGNIYITYSGQRGQKVPVSLYKITSNYAVKPFVTELMNPTGLALDRNGMLYVSCRNDGTIHRISPDGHAMQWIEGMGIATGLAFDKGGSLYCGDRSGTIFKISPDREIFVFATLEPSMAAYHLAVSPADELYVSGPTQSSFDRIHRISSAGEVSTFFLGVGRPQGIAFDRAGNLYVAASFRGQRGVLRVSADGRPEMVASGSGIVGLAMMRNGRAVVATSTEVYTLDWGIEGFPLYG